MNSHRCESYWSVFTHWLWQWLTRVTPRSGRGLPCMKPAVNFRRSGRGGGQGHPRGWWTSTQAAQTALSGPLLFVNVLCFSPRPRGDGLKEQTKCTSGVQHEHVMSEFQSQTLPALSHERLNSYSMELQSSLESSLYFTKEYDIGRCEVSCRQQSQSCDHRLLAQPIARQAIVGGAH